MTFDDDFWRALIGSPLWPVGEWPTGDDLALVGWLVMEKYLADHPEIARASGDE